MEFKIITFNTRCRQTDFDGNPYKILDRDPSWVVHYVGKEYDIMENKSKVRIAIPLVNASPDFFSAVSWISRRADILTLVYEIETGLSGAFSVNIDTKFNVLDDSCLKKRNIRTA